MRKVAKAKFEFSDGVCVTFYFDNGRPQNVVVNSCETEFVVDNTNGQYKPCVTHCRDLIDWKLGKKPKGNFAKQRKKKTKPNLRIVR